MIHHVMIRSAFGGFRRRRLLWPGASTAAINAGKILKPIPIQFLRQRSCYHMLSYVIIVFIVILHFSPYLCCFFFFKKGLIFQARDTSRWPAEMGWAFWHLERHEPQIWIDGFYHHTHTHIYIYMYIYIHIPPIKMDHLVVLPSSSIFIHLQSHSKQQSKMIGMNSPILSQLYFCWDKYSEQNCVFSPFQASRAKSLARRFAIWVFPVAIGRFTSSSWHFENRFNRWHVSDIEKPVSHPFNAGVALLTVTHDVIKDWSLKVVEMFQMELDDW